MSVTITRTNERVERFTPRQQKNNPWDLSDLSKYLYYCCPECDFKSRQDDPFLDHLTGTHQADVQSDDPHDERSDHHPADLGYDEDPGAEVKTEESDADKGAGGAVVSKAEVNSVKDVKFPGNSNKCPACNVSFVTAFRMQRHYRKQHGGQSALPRSSTDGNADDPGSFDQGLKPFMCPHCQGCFKTANYLSSHITKVHTKKHQCEICSKRFGTRSYLNEHIASVHEKKKEFQCHTCPDSFFNRKALDMHIKRCHEHTGDHPCDDCGRIYTNELSLKLHKKSRHSGVSHVCDQCGKVSTTKEHLKMHIQTVHEKLRPYTCDYCGKTFSTRYYVNLHIQRMHSGADKTVTFKCSDCPDVFYIKKERNAHTLRVHGKKYVRFPVRKSRAKPKGGPPPPPPQQNHMPSMM